MAGQRCPACGYRFQVLEDEDGMHECPSCGWFPGIERASDDDEAEVSGDEGG